MAITEIEGTYRDGKVELAELPAGIFSARVVVTFFPEGAPAIEGDDRQAAGARLLEALRRQVLSEIEQGAPMGGSPYPTREEIYGERLDELERRRRPRTD